MNKVLLFGLIIFFLLGGVACQNDENSDGPRPRVILKQNQNNPGFGEVPEGPGGHLEDDEAFVADLPIHDSYRQVTLEIEDSAQFEKLAQDKTNTITEGKLYSGSKVNQTPKKATCMIQDASGRSYAGTLSYSYSILRKEESYFRKKTVIVFKLNQTSMEIVCVKKGVHAGAFTWAEIIEAFKGVIKVQPKNSNPAGN